MKLESVVIAGQHPAVNMPLLLAHTARQTTLVGSGRGLAFWRARIWVQRGGLSRNKVSVGEPADGSPPTKLKKNINRSQTQTLSNEYISNNVNFLKIFQYWLV